MNNSKTDNFFKQKIKAFLHDPPEKPLILGLGEGHEVTSEDYIKDLLGNEELFDKDEWVFADHVASAADRTSFPMDYSNFKVPFRDDPIITHPNSGKQLDLGNFQAINATKLKENVQAVLEKIKKLANGNPEKMFLYLWRYFPELAKQTEAGNESLGLLWNYLPADTRIPDHSVLDHSRMVSAFAGAGIKRDKISASLLLFTIGPVQEFIAAARKTMDLWAGSYMLSWLSWQAMKVFCEEFGPDSILFPDLKGQPLVDYWLKYEKGLDIEFDDQDLNAPTLPNRFFAVIPKDDVQELATKAENVIREALIKIGNFTYRKLEKCFPDHPPGFDLWEKQLSHFTECYWAAMDLPDWKKGEKNLNQKFDVMFKDFFSFDDSNAGEKRKYREAIYSAYETGGFNPNLGTFYGRFYEIVEKAVGGRKALHDFNQIEEGGFRCSLIPGLAALMPTGEHIKPRVYKGFWGDFYKKAQKSDLRSKLGKNERLSPLALTKRFFPDFLSEEGLKEAGDFNPRYFSSTHTLAVADFKYEVITLLVREELPDLQEKLKAFLDAAHMLCEHLTLEMESPLPKIRYIAQKASIDCKMKAYNLCSLPGELLQTDYYDENFIDDLKNADSYKNAGKERIDNLVKDARDALSGLIKASPIKAPAKYYAILYLDGDNMGKWLSGDLAPEFWKVLHPKAVKSLIDGMEDEERKNHKLYKGWANIFEVENGSVKVGSTDNKKRPQAPTQHLAISRALNNFSLKLVRPIVEEEFLGRLIYAGGDDVVAMVSIGDALACAEKLRAAFSGHLSREKEKPIHKLQVTLANDDSNGYVVYSGSKQNEDGETQRTAEIATMLGPEASASCGIAIAHYMHPLKQALADARAAEKYAKTELGRDAFAVNVVKRSGESFVTGSKWRVKSNESGNHYDLIASDILDTFKQAIHDGKLSSKFIVDVEEIIDVLVALPIEATKGEVRRLFNQRAEGFKKMAKRGEDETEEDFGERVRREKEKFFKQTIQRLIEDCNDLGNNDAANGSRPSVNGKSADWPALRNTVKLMNMAYYIGKGGGR